MYKLSSCGKNVVVSYSGVLFRKFH